jgi:hypothetical protein
VIERSWFAIAPDGGEFEVVLCVAAPVREIGGGWSASASLAPLEDSRKIYGEDGWQAVGLAMQFLGARVRDYSSRGWKFFWSKGGEEASV